MRTHSIVAAALPLGLASGCAAAELSQTWQLDRLRVLGVAAEPAELAPGQTTALRSLVYAPADLRVDAQIWFACLPAAADDFGCALSSDALDAFAGLDPQSASPEALAAALEVAEAAGLIGFLPFLEPEWTAPLDALEGLDPRAASEGISALVNVSVSATDSSGDQDLELVYKRVPVSLSATPNRNPHLVGVAVDGEPWVNTSPLIVAPGAVIELEPLLSDDSIERYAYENTKGQVEERTEEPYFTWYAEGGSFEQAISLYPQAAREWTAPETAGFEGVIVVVVRDRRGGMAWTTVHVEVE